ncbi:hypothetical protein [uncultured Eubacterium sp.]|nr:hypothetical protein [uncultured Eubacterium sp.]
MRDDFCRGRSGITVKMDEIKKIIEKILNNIISMKQFRITKN